MKEVRIIADFREQNSEVPTHLSNREGVILEFQELPEGDYVLGPDVCVERKEANDFALSIMDRRLFSQALKMKGEYSRPIVLVEGNIFSITSGIDHEALIGALSYLSVIEGISVIYSDCAAKSAAMLATMARHAQHGLGYEVSLRANRPKDKSAVLQFIVEGLPGVGGARAQALLNYFGSPLAIFTAPASELAAVPGIGKELAHRIREAIVSTW